MSESDRDNINTNSSSVPEDVNSASESASDQVQEPTHTSRIFERLDQTLTKAAAGETPSKVVRIPRADRKSPVGDDQSKVVSLKRRSVKLMPGTVSMPIAESAPTSESTQPREQASTSEPTSVTKLASFTEASLVVDPMLAATNPISAPSSAVSTEPAVQVTPVVQAAPVEPQTSQTSTNQTLDDQSQKIDLHGAGLIHKSPMLPLIDRMEQQINKVTSSLMSRVEQVLAKLEEYAEELEKSGLSKQEQDQGTFGKLCDNVADALNHATEDARGKVLDRSTIGQRSIQSALEQGHTAIDQQSKDLLTSLLSRSKGLRIEHGQLAQVAQKKFSSLVKQRASDIHALVAMIQSDWEKLTATELQDLEERDARANDLVSKETDSINSTFDQYCQSLERDIDETWEQASYEINLTRKQCLAAADDALRIWQQRLILLTKSVIDSDIVPRLKELRDNLDNQVEELKQQFAMRYESERSSQIVEIEAEAAELKRQFRSLASEAEASVYDTISEQQLGLSQLFITHRDDIQSVLRNAEDELESIHANLKKSDASCRKLLISSAATLGLNLADDRENLLSNLQELRRATLQAMEDRLQQDTMTLEEASKGQRSKLTDFSSEHTRLIKEKSRTAISQIQAEVEQSFREIQQSREKFLL